MSELPLTAMLMTEAPGTAGVSKDAIRAFYDQHIVDKVADFVDGNPRVDAAWATIEQWAPPAPRAILEVGCGFGQISWQLASRWPDAQVTGFDISPRSIDLAKTVFERGNLSFSDGQIETLNRPAGFDLIVLVDVYEHIAATDRPGFDAALGRLLAPGGRLVLTFPTPAYQQFLRASHPDKLQPVDEDIDISVLQQLATATGTRMLMFNERSIWTSGDYAHAVLDRSATGRPVTRAVPPSPRLIERVSGKLRALWQPEAADSRAVRLRLIERNLGTNIYRPR